MKLRVAALALGTLAGFTVSWARMTDPRTFHSMLSLDSPRIYLLMGAAVTVAAVGARVLRGRRTLLGDRQIDWRPTQPTRSHVIGSVLFGIGWAVSEACPGPTAAQLGAGHVLAVAVAVGVVTGVKLQPKLARAVEHAGRQTREHAPAVPAAEVL